MSNTLFQNNITIIDASWLNDVNSHVYSNPANSHTSTAINTTQTGTGAQARTLQNKLSDMVCVFDFMTTTEIAGVQARTSTVDVTAAIQAAITAANGKTVYFPSGVYLVSSVITCPTDTQLVGESRDKVLIQRSAAHSGHTLVMGQDVPGLHAGAIRISGIWFRRDIKFNPGNTNYTAGTSTSVVNQLTGGQAHVYIHEMQRGLIEDCTFDNMPYHIVLSGGAVSTIRNNHFVGSIWDQLTAALQEGIASIYFKRTAASNHPTLINLSQNDFSGGYPSASRDVTIGSITANFAENVGGKFGLLIDAVEGLSSEGDYFGGHNTHSIYAAPATGATCTNIKISGAFFDGARLDCINLSHADASGNVVLVDITGCVFNGETTGQRALTIEGTFSASSTYSVLFSNNIVMAFIYTPIYIYGGVGVQINNNIISGYNCRGGNTGDALGSSAVYVNGPYTDKVRVNNNQLGGGVNNLSSSNNCQWGVVFNGTITEKGAWGNISNGLGLGGGSLISGADGKGAIAGFTLLNSWVAFGGGFRTPGYMIDSDGIVHLSGMVKSGTIGVLSCNLPVGFRPSGSMNFVVDSNGAYGRVTIGADGTVTPSLGNNAYVSFEGISFKAEQ